MSIKDYEVTFMLTHMAYEIVKPNTNDYNVYFSPGDLFKGENCATYGQIYDIRKWIDPARVHVNMSLEDIYKIDPENPIEIYRYKDTDTRRITDWYDNQNDAFEEAKAKMMTISRTVVNVGRLFPKVYDPVKLPVNVIVEKGYKGYYTRLELHPELNGPLDGKFYFPSRDCKVICEGPAIATSIVDKGNYGFVTMEMKKWELPSKSDLIYCLSSISELHEDLTVTEIKCPFGHIVIATNKDHEFIYGKQPSGMAIEDITKELEWYILRMPKNMMTIIGTLPITDYIQRLDNGMGMINVSELFPACQYNFVDAQDEGEDDPILSSAIEAGIFDKKSIGGIVYYVIGRNVARQLVVNYCDDDINHMSDIIKSANNEADIQIREKLQSGVIRLTL